jgi:AcrR family transcriptional regulator
MATAERKPRPQPRSEMQRQSVLDAASLLFIEKGFGGTNINDIADALGVTRTAVYYYFDSKEAILEALTEEVTEKASALARTVSEDLPVEDALRRLIVQHATLILSHPVQFRVVERSEASLPLARRKAAQAARRSVLSGFVQVIQRGLDARVFQAPDARTAAFAIIGMCNWTAWWFDAAKDSVEAVASQLAEFGLRALVRERHLQPRSTSPAETVQLLKEHLETLERQLQRPRQG